MTYGEISKIVQYNEKYESNNYMVNEIFEDLKSNIKNAPHIAFAYTYIYLCTWLYRYTKHFNIDIFDNAKIKEILGYDPNNRTLNYLIKKNGLLDINEMEYLESTRDYPISYLLTDDKEVEFTMHSEFEDIRDYFPTVPKRFFLKRPLKGFYRVIEDESTGEEYEIVGTFYEVDNTHNIPFEVFMYCMSNEKIGCTGFYLYAYLKHKNDLFGGGYDVSLEKLAEETGISPNGIDRYMNALKGYKLLDFIHNQDFFAIGMREEDRKANTYITNEYHIFSNIPVPFGKIKIMKKEDYFEMLKFKEEEEKEKQVVDRIDFDFDELPF